MYSIHSAALAGVDRASINKAGTNDVRRMSSLLRSGYYTGSPAGKTPESSGRGS